MAEYDYLIIGSGFSGSVVAHELNKKGKKCLVIDKRYHIGGNCYTEKIENINVHKYGAHIFHTNSKKVWEYINQFAEFNNYINSPVINYKDKLYSFPINLMTLYQLWGVKTPSEAKEKLKQEIIPIEDPKNLEEWVLSKVGKTIYESFIKGYTKKQWKTDPKNLPSSIIKRLPIRLTFNNNYFFDKYQGIPIGGYTQIFEKLLDGIKVELNVDYFSDRDYWNSKADKIIFTGRIDEFYGYKFGDLKYLNLKFETFVLNIEDFQGNAVVNYTDEKVPYTRIVEHKHFEFGKQEKTIITKEYPISGNKSDIPYYPVNDDKNNKLFKKYSKLSKQEPNIYFLGRLAEYKYYDMHVVVDKALSFIKRIG